MNIFVIFFLILERGIKIYFFFINFYLKFFNKCILYIYGCFFFLDIGYILIIMVLRIVKLGYLKRFSSKLLIVVFKEYYFKLIYDIFFINY